MSLKRKSRCALLLPLLLSVAYVRQAEAQHVVDFAGKTVTTTIGFEAGSRTDLYGRVLTQTMSRYLPGHPTFVVMNQPGAGGVVALNGWNPTADKNGLALAVGGQTQLDPYALAKTHAKYDPAKFQYIGGLVAPSQGLFVNKAALPRLFDKSKKPVAMGVVGSTLRTGYYQVLWGAAFLGWNVKWVLGYTSTDEVRNALERGEIDMSAFGSSKDIDYLLAGRNFTVASQSGSVLNGKIASRPKFGAAPVISDLVAGKLPDPAAKTAFDYSERVIQVGDWVALPEGAAKSVVSAYLQAFAATNKDPEYRSEWAKVDPDSPVASREELSALVSELIKVRPATLDYIQDQIARQGIGESSR